MEHIGNQMADKVQFWAEATKILLIVVILIVSLFDTFVMYRCGREATITDVVYKCACEWPIIAFGAGMVCGHIFWR